MERLSIFKKNLDYPCITLSYNSNVLLNIWFAGNLDLYFSILGDNKFIIDGNILGFMICLINYIMI